MKKICFVALGISMGMVAAFEACSTLDSGRGPSAASAEFRIPPPTAPDQGFVLIMGINDVHGHFAPDPAIADTDHGADAGDTRPLGGFQWLAAYATAARGALQKAYGERGQFLLLDGGDTAQGTLMSNPSEGDFAVKLMNQLQFTAGVPGNHAYDFGPRDPQRDQCPLGDPACDPLGTLKSYAAQAHFSVLSANVFVAGRRNERPEFLKPYVLVPFWGRNVAVVGIENSGTPSTTYAENVAALKFTDGVAETRAIALDLKQRGLADIVVAVHHEGDANADKLLGDWIEKVQGSDAEPVIDAVVGAHSHQLNERVVKGIPYIQSRWGGRYFGLIGLSVSKDAATGRLSVARDDVRLQAGIAVDASRGTFLDETLRADATVDAWVKEAAAAAAVVGGRKLGVLGGPLRDDGKRDADSEIGNFIADYMRSVSGAEVSLIGSGDVRVGIAKAAESDLLYQDLFDVIPKNLQLQKVAELPMDLFVQNVQASIRSCGRRGALQMSGAKVFFTRDCRAPVEREDPHARIVRIVNDAGEVIYPSARTTISIVTTDFIMTGGAGYRALRDFAKNAVGTNRVQTLGALRDLIADAVRAKGRVNPADHAAGRYVNCASTTCPTL